MKVNLNQILFALSDTLEGNKKSNHNILEQYTIHCQIGEDNVKDFPFQTDHKNIIKYHHENYDGSGVYGLKIDSEIVEDIDKIFYLR